MRNLDGPYKTDTLSSRPSARDKVCASIIEYGLFGLLILTPLPAASVHEWSILIIQIVVLVMAVAYVLMKEKPKPNKSLMISAEKLKLFFIGFFVFLSIQIIPLPKFLMRILSPGTFDYLKQYATDFSRLKFISLSIIPSYTLQRGLELMAYLLLGFLVLRTVTKRRQIIRILEALIVVGVGEAFYGLVELYDKNPRILFYHKAESLDSVTGTFVNRNHFSGYLEMVIPLAIGLVIARIGLISSASLTLRDRIVRFSEKTTAKNLLVFIGLVLMAIGVIFSKSRSGVFILVFSFILFFGLSSFYFDIYKFRKKWVKRFLQVAFLVIVSISLYIGIDGTLQRFSLDRLLSEGRPTYWANTLKTYSVYPLFGTGLGTFGSLYPKLEGESGVLSIEHAHNDYLEYLSELGLIGFGLLFGGAFTMAAISFWVWRTRRLPEVKGLGLGGIVALAAIFIHSFTDFNLQIPANLTLFSVILPLTMVIAFYERSAVPQEKK